MVIWSEEARKVILIELTVPWKNGCDKASERKATKYQDLRQCRDKGGRPAYPQSRSAAEASWHCLCES